MSTICGLVVVVAALVGAALFAAPAHAGEVFLFASFRGNGEDGLHLAHSGDGLNWTPLNDDRSYLRPAVGSEKLMRDPCIVRGPDGVFHMVWTTGWKGRDIGYASSKDLLRWSEQKALPVMRHEPDAINCWAPEVAYDAAAGHFLIFWATTIPGRFPATETQGDSKYNHRMYCTTTKDFATFTPTRLFFDPGFNVIDATMVEHDGRYHMVVKDETRQPAKKHLRITSADSAQGPFGECAAPFTPDWVEGPSLLKVDGQWICYFDLYTKHRYGAMRSKDLKTWEDVSDQLRLPKGTRHGTAFRVEASILQGLQRPAAATTRTAAPPPAPTSPFIEARRAAIFSVRPSDPRIPRIPRAASSLTPPVPYLSFPPARTPRPWRNWQTR